MLFIRKTTCQPFIYIITSKIVNKQDNSCRWIYEVFNWSHFTSIRLWRFTFGNAVRSMTADLFFCLVSPLEITDKLIFWDVDFLGELISRVF